VRRSISNAKILSHTGAHKINNTLGQGLLAIRMGKRRIIAETGAGQHGVATATACARFGLECVVYMGAEDVSRQAPNVRNMRFMGAEVRPVESGSRTLRDAINEAMRDWMGSVETTHYIIGSVVGPHPFPRIVRDFQSVIGRETVDAVPSAARPPARHGRGLRRWRQQRGRDVLSVRRSPEVRLVGVEAGGRSGKPGDHAASLSYGSPGILHGSLSYVLQDADGQTADVHSVSAGLDYPGVGPEHSYWRDAGRVEYTSVTDAEALDAFDLVARREGILPALETAHALAWAMEEAARRSPEEILVVCLSGRGDKDAAEIARLRGHGTSALA
jgi:tryptophan synthase beta chain